MRVYDCTVPTTLHTQYYETRSICTSLVKKMWASLRKGIIKGERVTTERKEREIKRERRVGCLKQLAHGVRIWGRESGQALPGTGCVSGVTPKVRTKHVRCEAAGARWGTWGMCQLKGDTLETSEALSARGKTRDRGLKWILVDQTKLKDNLAIYKGNIYS